MFNLFRHTMETLADDADEEDATSAMTLATHDPNMGEPVYPEEQVNVYLTHQPEMDGDAVLFQRCGGGRRVIKKRIGG